jgi:signal transduction histidine kinase
MSTEDDKSTTASYQEENLIEELKGMISSLTFEQRAPLTMIAGYSELLISGAFGSLNDKQTEAIGTMQKIVKRLIGLNNFVMDDLFILNLLLKHRELDLRQIEIGDWLTDSTTRYTKALEAKDQQLIIDVPQPQYTISDSHCCTKLLGYLVDNACKYSENGSQITISGKPRLKDILVTVTDNGIGIPEDEQPQIFAKWFRGKHEIVRKEEGSGGGLYLAKGLTKVLDSELGFESQEGKGSTFWFTLPLAKDEIT